MTLTVYSLPNCPACESLKAKLRRYQVPFQEQVIGKDVPREFITENFPGRKTAPIVVQHGELMTNESVDEYLNSRLLLE